MFVQLTLFRFIHFIGITLGLLCGSKRGCLPLRLLLGSLDGNVSLWSGFPYQCGNLCHLHLFLWLNRLLGHIYFLSWTAVALRWFKRRLFVLKWNFLFKSFVRDFFTVLLRLMDFSSKLHFPVWLRWWKGIQRWIRNSTHTHEVAIIVEGIFSLIVLVHRINSDWRVVFNDHLLGVVISVNREHRRWYKIRIVPDILILFLTFVFVLLNTDLPLPVRRFNDVNLCVGNINLRLSCVKVPLITSGSGIFELLLHHSDIKTIVRFP